MKGPLAGLRVLDLSAFLAGPWASTLLADFGAEVIKVELPASSGAGDAMRASTPLKDGHSLWWKTLNRNKRGITLDVRQAEGRALFLRLLPRHDVLVENFRPGTLDKWGLGADVLRAAHPRITILRTTGFGQTGPYRSRPGFGRMFEAMSGFTYLCGSPDGPPMHLGFPVGDAVGGLFGALGILAALFELKGNPALQGQEIDLSCTEAMFRMVEFLAAEHAELGVVRERTGNISPNSAPNNMYGCSDGRWVSMTTTSEVSFERLLQAMEMSALVLDPRFATSSQRVAHRDAIDAIVERWVGDRSYAEVAKLFDAFDVAYAPVYSIADVAADPHFLARRSIVRVDDEEIGSMAMHDVVPRFSRTPGQVRSAGPRLGADNESVFAEIGISASELARLTERGVV
ncbi:CoA transferase [Variovorax sp. J22P168]|uniref:CaiB/BaiF CoA transferase family protein n=1 Tax=Variovorax jilinensis TaxID=3053513 RepID=UPI0025786716|nr:CoA transferase [Variovorax sp. J22P168]MDM0015166.1 CoA transferase [Variovorax sp. J22P168]